LYFEGQDQPVFLTLIVKELRIFDTSATICHATTPSVSQDMILHNICISVMAISYLTEVTPHSVSLTGMG